MPNGNCLNCGKPILQGVTPHYCEDCLAKLGLKYDDHVQKALDERKGRSAAHDPAPSPNILPPMPTLEALALRTERLDLIPINREHAPVMFEVLNDPALYTFTNGSPPRDVATLAHQYEFWEKRRSPDGAQLWFNWALRVRAHGELVGHLQAGVLPDHADMAWTLGSKWQHHGYAIEAAKAVLEWLLQLKVCEFRASINSDHAASIRVAEGMGLRRSTELSGTELIWKRVYGSADDPGVKEV